MNQYSCIMYNPSAALIPTAPWLSSSYQLYHSHYLVVSVISAIFPWPILYPCDLSF